MIITDDDIGRVEKKFKISFDEERKRGTAIIFVGEDLDVLMALSDRIMVMADHRIAGITDARTVTKDYLGSLMTDTKGQVI